MKTPKIIFMFLISMVIASGGINVTFALFKIPVK